MYQHITRKEMVSRLSVLTILTLGIGHASGQACSNGSAKIVGGPSDTEGSIEVCKNGGWYQVCDYGWSQEDAVVACNSMGFSGLANSHASGSSQYGGTGQPIGFSNFQCTGIESSLGNCISSIPSSTCTINSLAGIKCTPKGTCEAAGFTSCCTLGCVTANGCLCDYDCYSFGDCCYDDITLICPFEECSNGSARIVGGPFDTEGLIEVCNEGEWNQVCDDGWSQEDAIVACKSMGFSGLADSHAYGSSQYNSTGQPIGFSNFQCTGVESSLGNCINSIPSSSCSNSTLAGIKCTPKGTCENDGHTSCCTSECGTDDGCWCDYDCYNFGNCCYNDIDLTCPYKGIACASEIDAEWNILWQKTPAGVVSMQSCSNVLNTTGTATRACNENGEWQKADLSSCQTQEFMALLDMATEIFGNISTLSTEELEAFVVEEVPVLLEQLSIMTTIGQTDGESLLPNDLSASNSILTSVVSVLQNFTQMNHSIPVQIANSFVDVVDNILEDRNLAGWQTVEATDPSMGSELLLDNTESFALLLADSLAENETEVTFSRENIVVKVKNVPVIPDEQLQPIVFPEPDDIINFTSPITNIPAIITIPSSILIARAEGMSNLPVANAIFNNLDEYLMSSATLENDVAETVLLSSQVGVRRDNINLLSDPVTIDFFVPSEIFSSPLCVFWNFSEIIGNGTWSSAGIETRVKNSSQIRCESSHLTSFAVLVDTTNGHNETPSVERLALSILSYIGCVISIVCLILTVIFFLTFGKKLLTNVLNLIHLNLALALLCAYTVFVAGMETAVGNSAACTAVAVLLLYFFLASFCWMLCEGVMLYLMLVVIFSGLRKKWWFFLLLGWLPPVIPVAVSLGLAHDDYTQGVDYCWLSTTSSLIWAFVAPVLVIITVNTAFFCLVMVTVVRNQRTRNLQLEKDQKVSLVISTAKATVVLLPLLGLTWLFGLFAVNENTTIFAWLFIIFNSLQGVAICFFHVIRNEKVWNILCKARQKKAAASGATASTSQPTFSSSHGRPDMQKAPSPLHILNRPESVALSLTDKDNKINNNDLAKKVSDKPEDDTSIGKSHTAVVTTPTIIQFDNGGDDSEDDYPDLNVNDSLQFQAGKIPLQVIPAEAVDQNLLQGKDNNEFSSPPGNDKIYLL